MNLQTRLESVTARFRGGFEKTVAGLPVLV